MPTIGAWDGKTGGLTYQGFVGGGSVGDGNVGLVEVGEIDAVV